MLHAVINCPNSTDRMQLYFLLYLLVLVGELLAAHGPGACRSSQQYWVKPTDSDSCKCTSASVSTLQSNSTVTANVVTRRCATITQYAECLSNGTCKKNALMKEKCLILIFLPGVHGLTRDLYISKRASVMMIKEPKCNGSVEIHLKEAGNITLSHITRLTLADISIINDNLDSQKSLTLMNVPSTWARYYSIFSPPPIVYMNNVSLSGSILVYECNSSRCKGTVKLVNIWFNNSYASIAATDCPDVSMYLYSWHLFLSPSQTGIVFNTLQLKSVLIDNLQTLSRDNTEQIRFNRHDKPAPAYDLLFQSIHRSRSVANLSVTIQNCRLERSESTGLLIEVIVACTCHSNFNISNTTISNHNHGGIMIHQPSVSKGRMNVIIEGSHISYNQISMLNHHDHEHYAAGLSVHSETIDTTTVTIRHTEFTGNIDSRSRPVIVYITRAFRVLIESCSFTDNGGTAIQLNNVNDNCAPESFNFKGVVNFTRNSGYQGGALSLISAVISIKPNTTLIFADNRAIDVGGAIFVDTNIPYNDETDPDTLVSCFYRFPMWNNDSKSYSISFSNNIANNGGNNIYGASLKCYCTVFTGGEETVRSIDKSVTSLFSIDDNDHLSSISSTPYRVCLTDSDDSVVSACTNLTQIFNHEINVYPGQEFSLEAVLAGYEFGQGTGTVNAQLLDHSSAEIWPKRNRFQRIETPTKAELRYTLYSNDTRDNVLVLTAEKRNEIDNNLQEVEVSLQDDITEFHSSGIISSNLLSTPVYVKVRFKPECPPGFTLRQHPNVTNGCDTCKASQSVYRGCHCLEKFETVMECLFDSDHEDGYLCLKKPVWVELNEGQMLFSAECPFDYCDASFTNITVDPNLNNSSLCNNDREGKLCGNCVQGYSLMLGSNKCAICSNKYIGLLAFFAVAGILLVILIIVSNVTVAQGTINGLIFYANIVWAYNEIFFPRYDDGYGGGLYFFKVFIAWLNLDLGIEVCFFDGLNAYSKAWLQFVFPVYIWVIAGVIILLGRLRYLHRLLPENIVQVLATLVLLSYSKLLRTVITALVPATIDIYSNGSTTKNSTDIVWKFDGEVKYGRFPHGMLLSVALLVIVILWIPYTLILLFIRYTRSWKIIRKLMPFFECYTGHLTPNCQFWVGLLLLVRCVLLMSLIFFHPDACVLSMVVIIILIFVLLYNTGSIYNDTTDIRRYKCCSFLPESLGFQQISPLSMLDISFLLNLAFLGVAVLYADFEERNQSHIKAKAKAAVTYTSIGIVMVQFIGIIIYPRLKGYILDKCITHPPDPAPGDINEPDDRYRQATHNSIEGVPQHNDEDDNKDANT